jgi:uncharacterized membrane protein (UPF0127 family)
MQSYVMPALLALGVAFTGTHSYGFEPALGHQVSDDTVCPENQLWLRGRFGQARFNVQVADTEQSRARGLMHVPAMASSAGMLFVYPKAGPVAFWMKNTLISLDIIYADEKGVVQNIQANAIPGDLTPLPGRGNIQYVLEINGGMDSVLGIQPGDQLRHRAISDAIWACP